ncbi:DMT family transporter [Seleniivibrio woodruffii]|uniref:DMT family transporter n=1 Tax=Seleniivibrio woodruffii TaxID=1078050 RepID=UPI0026EDBB1D|nr:DMT family transporter [Seleniivibrio woodruffii]
MFWGNSDTVFCTYLVGLIMSDVLFYLMMVLAMVSWGESWVSAKIVAKMASPEVLMFWRFFLTFISYIPVMIYLKQTFTISRKGILFTFVCSVVLILYNEMFFTGLIYGMASVGGILVTTLIPVVTFLLVSLLTLKSPSLKDAFGLMMGACGAMVIIKIWDTDIEKLFHSGNIYFLTAAFLWAILTYLGAYVKKYTNVFTYSFYLYLFTTGLIALITIAKGTSFAVPHTFVFWGNMTLLAVGATTFGSTLFFIAAARLGSQKTSSFVYLVPVNAVGLSWFFLGEQIHVNTLTGGLLVFMAVYIINRKSKTS